MADLKIEEIEAIELGLQVGRDISDLKDKLRTLRLINPRTPVIESVFKEINFELASLK